MTLLEIFEKVNLTVPIEQRDFFNHYDTSVSEIQAKYGSDKKNLVFKENTTYEMPGSLNDDNNVLPLYDTAIVENILFLSGQGDAHKSEFLRLAHNAYLNYWNMNAKGRYIKKVEW